MKQTRYDVFQLKKNILHVIGYELESGERQTITSRCLPN